MTQMRRQSLVKFDAPLCETIIDAPKPQGREVLVKIERCGLCHSDLHIQDGYADLGGGKKLDTTRGMTLPFTLGHEIAGVVAEVGPDAPQDLIGTKKAVFPWIGCGKCRDCLAGDENLCAKNRFLGVSIDGGFATHVLVPDAKYLLDYDPLPTNVAATLMCSGITAYGALKLEPQARAVFRREREVRFRKDRPAAARAAGRGASAAASAKSALQGADLALFEALRAARLDIARALSVPPYVVFPDTTLIAFATERPTSRSALLGISGVGQSKLERYGEAFLKVIREHQE